jgi:iron complex outermembrane receptor protein
MSEFERVLALSSIVAVALTPISAFAQAEPENSVGADEIVVTAQRREERAVDVPITVTALSQEVLSTANVQNLSDIGRVTPGLRFDFAGGFFQPTIRGVGTAVTTSGGGSNVGIYVDGFYSPNPRAANFQLLNTNSIQVLKGPQGTLFGRNTTGGAILVQTTDPSTTTSAEVKALYGRFDRAEAQGYATFGISDKVALDIEGIYDRSGNWLTNIATGQRDGGEYKNWSVRLGLKASLSDATSVLIRYAHNSVDDPGSMITNAYVDPVLGPTVASFVPPSSYTTNPDDYAPGRNHSFFRSNANTVQGTIKSDLGFANLTSYSQYRKEDTDSSLDNDRTGVTIFQTGIPVNDVTWSQEFLLASKSSEKLQWTAGLFYMSNRDTYLTFLDNNSETTGRVRLGGSSTTTSTYAAFLDATYEARPNLFLTLGGRYAHDTVTDAYYNIIGTNGARQYVPDLKVDRFTPRAVIRYKPGERSSIYASYTRGYKAGILDVGGGTGNPVKPETIDAFEVGYKFDDRRFSFEGSAFYYDYKNLQVSLFKGTTAQLVNAASSHIYGLDGQIRYKLDDHFQVSAGATWTHARYALFENAPIYMRCPQAAGCGGGTSFFIQPTTLRDVTMQRTPEFTANAGARYATKLAGGEIALSGNFYCSSKFYFGPSGIQFPQNGYGVLSLRAEWTDPSEHYSIALWGDNVTDSRYLNTVQYGTFGVGASWNRPATYGVELGAKF